MGRDRIAKDFPRLQFLLAGDGFPADFFEDIITGRGVPAPAAANTMFPHLSSREHSRRLLAVGWALVAAVPLAFIGSQVIEASRNIAFQDELDTAIDFLVRLDAGAGWNEIFRRIFALSNEHRTATSRLLFAASYWLTGTVNFHVIGAIGNLFILAACGILIAAVGTIERRIRLGVVLAFLTFQLGNFENFLWSGASIDHFQVVMLAVGAFALLARNSRGAAAGAAGLAGLATFTLAHGSVTWLVGAAMLGQQRRWRRLALWSLAAALVLLGFLQGFAANPGHQIPALTVESALRIGHYWLALIGAPLAFGHSQAATALGAGGVAALGWVAWRRTWVREPVAIAAIAFAIISLGLVAYGRAEIAAGQIASRYIVLGTLVWSLLCFLALEAWTDPVRPYRLLGWCVPALFVFNFSANAGYALRAEDFVEARDRAALRFKQYGVDGRGQTRLHPQDGHADVLLREAEARGIYRLPRLCFEAEVPEATPSTQMIGYVDENMITASAISLGGWAMLPGCESERGQVHVILRSAQRSFTFTTITVKRPDVAQAYREPRWRLCGFRFVILRFRVPIDDYQVGLLITEGDRTEYLMTDQWVRLAHPNPDAPVRFNTL
jgi:hypothetical protein